MAQDVTLTGLVLRRWDQGESDRRLSVLTAENGRTLLTAKGARKPSSRLAGVSEPLALATFQVNKGFIVQAQTLPGFRAIRRDFDRLSVALAFIEIVAGVSQLGDADEGQFQAIIHALKEIELHSNPHVVSVWAQLRLMQLEGVLPQWTRCVLDGGELNEDPAWISPMAGGYVTPAQASEFSDRALASAAVLIGLERTAELDCPPPKLRKAEEAVKILHPFWLHHLGRDLPANVQLQQNLGL